MTMKELLTDLGKSLERTTYRVRWDNGSETREFTFAELLQTLQVNRGARPVFDDLSAVEAGHARRVLEQRDRDDEEEEDDDPLPLAALSLTLLERKVLDAAIESVTCVRLAQGGAIPARCLLAELRLIQAVDTLLAAHSSNAQPGVVA